MADEIDNIFDKFDTKIVSLMEGLEEHLRDVAIGVQDEMRDYVAMELRDNQSEIARLKKQLEEKDQEIAQLNFKIAMLEARIDSEKEEKAKAVPVIWTKKNERLFKNASVTINRALRDLKPGSKTNPIDCDE